MNTKPVIIDVRESEEYASSHAEEAINIPVGHLLHSKELDAVPKDSTLVLYCNSGNRSGLARELLLQRGFTKVINGINQTYVRSWLKENER